MTTTQRRPSIDDVRDLQRSLGLLDTHIIYLDEEGFVIAHTDVERLHKSRTPLEECPLHKKASAWTYSPLGPGYFTATPEPDSDLWNFQAILICDR